MRSEKYQICNCAWQKLAKTKQFEILNLQSTVQAKLRILLQNLQQIFFCVKVFLIKE